MERQQALVDELRRKERRQAAELAEALLQTMSCTLDLAADELGL